MNYSESIKVLTNNDNFKIKLGLDRISNALSLLGNPQDKLKFIHVAGTNGKGSVCAILESILRESGYKTGLYTSPHIWNYTERIKFNGQDIEEQTFANYVKKIISTKIPLTEFEILTIIAFLYFVDRNTDIVILETGLGGRLDATNVIKENICSVITHIDFDHTDRLGNTLEQIAYEKAGIIKKNCPLVTGMKYKAIDNKASVMNSKIIEPAPLVDKLYIDALNLKGEHQIENLSLVISVIKNFFKNISETTILSGLKKVNHPCRFQYIKEKNLIVDASHNPNGIEALRRNLDLYFPTQKRRFIFGCLNTKDSKKMMNILFREGDEIYLNQFDYPNACTYEELKSSCKYKTEQYSNQVILTPDKLNIICGSFYMISQINY